MNVFYWVLITPSYICYLNARAASPPLSQAVSRLDYAKDYAKGHCKMAPSKKRKRETENTGSDDDDVATYGLRQILPVANLPIDFEGEPLDGMQYLFLVRCVLSFFR